MYLYQTFQNCGALSHTLTTETHIRPCHSQQEYHFPKSDDTFYLGTRGWGTGSGLGPLLSMFNISVKCEHLIKTLYHF